MPRDGWLVLVCERGAHCHTVAPAQVDPGTRNELVPLQTRCGIASDLPISDEQVFFRALDDRSRVTPHAWIRPRERVDSSLEFCTIPNQAESRRVARSDGRAIVQRQEFVP
jgi:hypothetical protein